MRKDQRGVASTVGTMLSLLVVLLFIQLAVLAPIPRQLYEAEWKTSQEALEAYGFLRSTLTGPMPTGGSISVRFPSGTPAVSPLASPSGGRLAFDAAATGPTMSFKFVPSFLQAEVTKLNQDVILLIDSSGSMGSSSCTPGSSNCNDPWGLRICGAQEYVANLRYPDRVAIIDFDGTARLVRTNHHLNNAGHDGRPDFADPRTDLGTIAPCNQRYGNSGWTNFGDAIRIANDEFNQYGDLDHVYVMILLTDGQNNQPWQDTMAQREARRARALGITIFTIGLGEDLNEPLLMEIANVTGGSYYAAPTAESIRWIYFDISRKYTSSFQCSEYVTIDQSVGILSLDLSFQEYPRQTFRLESGGIAVLQGTRSVIREGLPIDYRPSSLGGGALSMTTLTFLGSKTSSAGSGYEVVTARLVSQDLVEQSIANVALDVEADEMGNISTDLQYWADQGAATPGGAAAVRAPLESAQAEVLEAHAKVTAGDIVGAKTDVDQAQGLLAETILVVEAQVALNQVQSWLGDKVKDEVLVEACRLDQWGNWYDGITITLASPGAEGWADWFEDTMTAAGATVTVGLAPGVAVVSIHGLDEFVVDQRVVQISFGVG